ncbi:DUF7710 domain-containing protein [Pilimelia columellifera]|uniref:DUF7710 domain-containing protein n=1 Tax=Pilimelia columellifera subsp. columellifera TaxID=706583 RepID=A0ABN3NIT6_9ACTN
MNDDQAVGGEVWVFQGSGARFPAGVFTDRASAMAWVERHRLTGVLTRYPVGDGCYDIAVKAGRFTPSKTHHGSADHVANFSPAGPHIHVRDGRRD